MANISSQESSAPLGESDGLKQKYCSFVADRLNSSCTKAINELNSEEEISRIKKINRSPSDEILMTELAIDCKELTVYDISSVIIMAGHKFSIPHGEFKCYMDHKNKEFFIDVSTKTNLEAFTRSSILNLLQVAKDAKAGTVYICVRKTIDEQVINAFLRKFLFIGFMKLTQQEQQKISMTKTHILIKYNMNLNIDEYQIIKKIESLIKARINNWSIQEQWQQLIDLCCYYKNFLWF